MMGIKPPPVAYYEVPLLIVRSAPTCANNCEKSEVRGSVVIENLFLVIFTFFDFYTAKCHRCRWIKITTAKSQIKLAHSYQRVIITCNTSRDDDASDCVHTIAKCHTFVQVHTCNAFNTMIITHTRMYLHFAYICIDVPYMYHHQSLHQ